MEPIRQMEVGRFIGMPVVVEGTIWELVLLVIMMGILFGVTIELIERIIKHYKGGKIRTRKKLR